MNRVRLGLIGLGNIGRHHAEYLLAGKVGHCDLTAVCARSAGSLEPYAKKGLATWTNAEDLVRSGTVDAVLIATPHYDHTTLGIAALEAGLHVMVEKPISAHKADAERLIKIARLNPALKFAAMFQLRVEPRYKKLRALIRDGELGRVVRVNWINTDWFRTEAYYASSEWRATWKGEGGGVLLNQCLHNLDVLAWLLGPAARVRGFCQLGRFHQIEVEDNVTAYFELPGGGTGVFVSSTGESPGTNRLEIVGTRGKVVLEDSRMRFVRNESDMLEFSACSPSGFAKPEVWNVEIPFENATAPHAQIMENFVQGILDGAELITPAEEGLHSVELANAIVYSSLIGETVEIPLDAAAYELKLQELIAASTVQKHIRKMDATDFAASFRR
ncbi:MAG TPA: Gfo/Idh/MocA family oxidoreductase [Candidatus Limnocylindria bacterium]|nr:Gfo/Idh/MocA family oxidoreductase [Candidatus Limnocylindria bacterium]